MNFFFCFTLPGGLTRVCRYTYGAATSSKTPTVGDTVLYCRSSTTRYYTLNRIKGLHGTASDGKGEKYKEDDDEDEEETEDPRDERI